MKQFSIKQGDEVKSVVEHYNNGTVFVKESDDKGVFIKSVNGFSFEVTENRKEAGHFYNGDVDNIVWYIMGSIEKYNGYQVETTVIEEFK